MLMSVLRVGLCIHAIITISFFIIIVLHYVLVIVVVILLSLLLLYYHLVMFKKLPIQADLARAHSL